MQEKNGNTLTPPAETEQAPQAVRLATRGDATPWDATDIGPCRECGSPVIQSDEHFTCSKVADGGCTFVMAIKDVEAVVRENVADLLHDALIGGRLTGELVSELLHFPEKQKVTWHDGADHDIFEYCEFELVKNSAGQWVLCITRDDEELAAHAKEGFARMCEE